jgi:hypothetical protein
LAKLVQSEIVFGRLASVSLFDRLPREAGWAGGFFTRPAVAVTASATVAGLPPAETYFRNDAGPPSSVSDAGMSLKLLK